MEETTVGIAMFPDGKVIMCSGVIVGSGLGVVRLPEPDEDGRPGYSVTHVATGRRVPDGRFYNNALAVRCARELIRIFAFDQLTLAEIRAEIPTLWRTELAPIVARYLRLDSLWLERQEQLG